MTDNVYCISCNLRWIYPGKHHEEQVPVEHAGDEGEAGHRGPGSPGVTTSQPDRI